MPWMALGSMAMQAVMKSEGGGQLQVRPQTPNQAISKAQQRIHDLAGGQTGSFNVSTGGKYANYLYIGVVGMVLFMVLR